MKGYPPTIGEIQENLGYRNPGYVHKVLSSLERKGYITRKKGEHRGIRLSELSENMLANRQMSFLKNDEEKN
jgi:SOS-response transcriptional repressor LexA